MPAVEWVNRAFSQISPDRTQGGRRNTTFVKQLHIDRRRPGRPRLAIPLPRSPAPPQPIAQKAPPPAPSIRAATSPSHPLYPGSISNNAFSHLTLHETRQRPSRHPRIAPTKRRAVAPLNLRPPRLDARVREITVPRREQVDSKRGRAPKSRLGLDGQGSWA
jgi:hypothetical protein